MLQMKGMMMKCISCGEPGNSGALGIAAEQGALRAPACSGVKAGVHEYDQQSRGGGWLCSLLKGDDREDTSSFSLCH